MIKPEDVDKFLNESVKVIQDIDLKPLFEQEDSVKSEIEIPIEKPKIQNYISQQT